jgi:hypothetical protein
MSTGNRRSPPPGTILVAEVARDVGRLAFNELAKGGALGCRAQGTVGHDLVIELC